MQKLTATIERRRFNAKAAGGLAALLSLAYSHAYAMSLGDLSEKDASQGLKTALEKSAQAAVGMLGKAGGFMDNDKVRIPLPGYLDKASKVMKRFGLGGQIDELVTSMNRAAESAIPLSQDVLMSSIKSMSVSDAKSILTGGDTSVTQFFADKTRAPLTGKFLPVVTQTTEKVGAAAQYNALASKAASFGVVSKEDANIQQYVTGKTLDGLYTVIGEEEKKLRQNPVAAGSAILSKVFGAIR
jgi:Protein of unknown function (DUF4197)